MNLFQSTGRTLFYLKNWGQLTADSSVHCSQKVWRFETSDKASKSISAFANIHDGRYFRLESYLRARRLYDHDRSVRHLDDSSHRRRVKEYLCFQFQDQMFHFCVLPFGLSDAPRAFAKTLKPPAGT